MASKAAIESACDEELIVFAENQDFRNIESLVQIKV
jgi:hypothetical protein